MPAADVRNLTAKPPNYNLAATIASGATTSDEVDLGGDQLCGLFVPAAFTGTAVTITAAPASGGTFVAVIDPATGLAYTLTVAAGKYAPISNLAFTAGLRFVKLVSGSAETPARVVILATRPV